MILKRILKKFYVGSGVNLRVSDFLPGWRSRAHNDEAADCKQYGELVFSPAHKLDFW
jgi:hypothetical protein